MFGAFLDPVADKIMWVFYPVSDKCTRKCTAGSFSEAGDHHQPRGVLVAPHMISFAYLLWVRRVCTSLILLTTSPPSPIPTRIMVLPVALMVCREITMSSLREWAAAAGGSAQKVGAQGAAM